MNLRTVFVCVCVFFYKTNKMGVKLLQKIRNQIRNNVKFNVVFVQIVELMISWVTKLPIGYQKAKYLKEAAASNNLWLLFSDLVSEETVKGNIRKLR